MNALRILGGHYKDRGLLIDAEELLQEAIVIGKREQHLHPTVDASILLAEVLLIMPERYKDACTAYKEALILASRIGYYQHRSKIENGILETKKLISGEYVAIQILWVFTTKCIF